MPLAWVYSLDLALRDTHLTGFGEFANTSGTRPPPLGPDPEAAARALGGLGGAPLDPAGLATLLRAAEPARDWMEPASPISLPGVGLAASAGAGPGGRRPGDSPALLGRRPGPRGRRRQSAFPLAERRGA